MAAAVCAVLAILSALVLPTVPSYDPWSWIVWGREVTDSHLSFTVGGGPSWKPLPFLFTTLWGLFGGAGPTLWVITARAGGLLGVVAAYRLGALLAARADPRARWLVPAAGVIAALGLVLTQEWTYYMFRGTSEPMLLGAALWAIDRHLAGRYMTAFWLGVAASLIRPEAWPFILLYAVWLWWNDRRPRRLAPLLMGLAAIPVLWFGPPWVGSGQPFIAASHAKSYNGHLGSDPFFEVLRRGADLQVTTLLVLGVAAVALTWWRERDRIVLGLAGAALAWWALVTAMTLDGYPGLERFFLPAAGLVCVLAAAAIVRLADLAVGRVGALGGVVVAVGLVAVALALAPGRLSEARAEPHQASRAVTRLDQLTAAVRAVGGNRGVFPCRTSFAAVNHGVQTALAWKLRVTLERVGTSMRRSGVMFVGPHDAIDGGPAAVSRRLDHQQLIAQVGVWTVYRVWRGARPGRCVGG
jgi:hypothetical protein